MEHVTYFLLDMVFLGIPGVYLYTTSLKKLRKYYKTLLAIFIFSLFIFFIFDPIAIKWGAWIYNSEKTIGIQFQGAAIETLFSSILVCLVIGFYALISAEKEGKRKH